MATGRIIFPEELAAADAGVREGGVDRSVAYLGVRRDSVDGGKYHARETCIFPTAGMLTQLWCVLQGPVVP